MLGNIQVWEKGYGEMRNNNFSVDIVYCQWDEMWPF